MRIGEIAELAGVTVRTIRYYHQHGVLPEPARLTNGYREYTVDDLVSLIRIRHLTASGVPLAQAGRIILHGADAAAEAALDSADEVLKQQIDQLTEQRRRLAQARHSDHLGLSDVAAAFVTSADDVPVSVLFAHLYAEGQHTAELIDTLKSAPIQDALASAQNRFDQIDAQTTLEELEALAKDLRSISAAIAPYVREVADHRDELLMQASEGHFNEYQRTFLRSLS